MRRRPPGISRPKACPARRATSRRLCLPGDAHLDRQGGRLFGLGAGSMRWIPTDASQQMDIGALDGHDRGRPRRRARALHGGGHGGHGQHRRYRSAAGNRSHLPGGMASGSTWMAPTARWPPPCRSARRTCRIARGRLDRAGPAQVALQRRSRPAARWSAIPDIWWRRSAYHPRVLQLRREDEDPPINYYDFGLQNSRGFRALKVWLASAPGGARGLHRG